MRVCVGCSFTRDARGNPDKMELQYADLPQKEAAEIYGKFIKMAYNLQRLERWKVFKEDEEA